MQKAYWVMNKQSNSYKLLRYMHTPETLEFINSDAHTNTNKNMTFELLKVCWPANPN